MTTDVVITQPNYLPWRGYFDQFARADVFVLLTDVQYTRRDWRNRNRIRTHGGLRWITIPVEKGPRDQLIRETIVAPGEDWPRSHWDAIRVAYAAAPFYEEEGPFLEELLHAQRGKEHLADVCADTLVATAERLGIDTPLHDVGEYLPLEESVLLDPTERLVTIALRVGATRYITGPSAADYLELNFFHDAGIEVGWMDYSGYEPYQQIHQNFEGAVSIVDTLLNVGHDGAPSTWGGGSVSWGTEPPA